MRICLFTDTLGDVNGVSRFIRDIADRALATGRDLRILTSTRLEIPERPNLINFPPLAAMSMPGYANLELALPPFAAMRRYIRSARPDVIHISTPGPVGCVGRRAAAAMGLPLLGVYHTDFPAYIDRLFGDDLLTTLGARAMRRFYRPFDAVFTRSTEYAAAVARIGVPPERIVRLMPGIDTERFSTAHRDPGVWERAGVPRGGVRVLYCGRVSVEKNLPLLVPVWRRVRARLAPGEARLLIIGDGPYRAAMERELAGDDVRFLGFRHGPELSALYASADLFVFPSITDTLGQVVMEAQASGLPVLVSDRGGPQEVVGRGVTGLVLPAADPHAWAGAIVDLVRDGDHRRAMGEAAARAIRPMSIAASFDHWWTVHESAVSSRRHRCTRPGPGRG